MEMDPRLKTAAETGDIDVLHVLIRENPHILEHIDKIPFIQTPLHTAAHEGQISFAMEMINLKPSFANKLNLDGLSPMHLALINGQTKLVLRLLKTDEDLVRVKGWQGKTPFHYAATTGNSKLLFEFLEACPECIEDVTVRDETALHLALKHDHVEAFKLLFGWLLRSPLGHKIIAFETKMVNWKDNDDNTVLHIAAMKEQREALKLLLDSSILLRVKAKNSEGLTAQDIIEKVERPDTNIDVKDEEDYIEIDFLKEKINCVERYFVLGARARRCMSVDVINTMLVVMALIITAVYQSSLSPPGGVWQGDNNDSIVTTSVLNVVTADVVTKNHYFPGRGYNNNSTISKYLFGKESKQAGTMIMNPYSFGLFWTLNVFTFGLSIVITGLLLFGLYILMFLAVPLYLLVNCYFFSMTILSPSLIWSYFNLCILFILLLVPVALLLELAFKSTPIMKKTTAERKYRTELRKDLCMDNWEIGSVLLTVMVIFDVLEST
ncbi:hypothetical protein like AT4G10720 [Hibiscus trionum]|uniref:PGG domain-containing protein n=1 Tax=Hibiscus trionum TaxID=183268 RepID=A0A9W7HKT5_HIBTR|nr:hypothetical protein like AT4G10720 [Hibiscus trionum]